MKLYLHAQPFGLGPSVLALGMFDGVHLGHRKVLEEAKRIAQAKGLGLAAVSFDRHPLSVLRPEETPKLLTTNTEKAKLLNAIGVGALVLLRFDRDFAAQEPEEYLRFLKEKYAARHLVMGENHRFGRDGKGNAETVVGLAQRLQLGLTVVPPQALDGAPVSSTRVRQALQAGDLAVAAGLLGYLYHLQGAVVHGKGLGHGFGFPTINLGVSPDKQLPRYGVYGALARVGQQVYRAVCNVGVRPTVNGESPSVEAFLLDFQGDVYGERASLALLDFYRPEMRFSSTQALSAQVARDAARARRELPKPF